MAPLINRIKSLFGRGDVPLPPVPPADPLDYEQLVTLDAESLAEQGILSAYAELSARLEPYSPSPLEVREVIDNDGLGYSVYAGDQQYVVWEVIDGVQNEDGWERATVAFFQIVNARLKNSSHRFYALNGGNDLFGIFLTEEEFAAARRAIPKRSNWPWMPDNAQPDYGFPVDAVAS